MARRGKGSSTVAAGKGDSSVAEAVPSSPQPRPQPAPAEVVYRRLRTLRRKLTAEAKKTAGAEAQAGQENTAVSRVAMLRAAVKELEELSRSVSAAESGTNASAKQRQQGADADVEVHRQTLRLACAASSEATGGQDVGDDERAKLAGFYGMLVAAAKGDAELDEKLSLTAADIADHLRLFAGRDRAQVSGIKGIADVSYAELAGIVDRSLGSDTDNGAVRRSRGADSQAVKMPMLKSMSVNPSEGPGTEDGDFSAQVVVPPGGLSFIASAAVVNGSDGEEAGDDAEVPEVPMPAPVHHEGESKDGGADSERVGGFTHPTKSFVSALEVDKEEQAPEKTDTDKGDASVRALATAAVQVDNAAVSAPPLPSGYNAFGAPPAGVAPNWSVAGSTTAGVVAPGTYGMMPLPYPPHIAMQYGYMPPHMFSMPAMSGVAATGGPSGAGSNASPSARASPVVVDPVAAAVPSGNNNGGIVPGHPAQGEMWALGIGAKNHPGEGGGVAASSNGNHPVVAGATMPGLEGAPTPPVMMSMPGSDPYQQNMALAAAAAGFTMNPPFMYPHIDASNLSTAATGGSENNGSVNSVDSATVRTGSSGGRAEQAPQPQQVPDGTRGLVHPEYSQAMQYMWPQQQQQQQQAELAKYSSYGYIQQPQAYPQQHPPPPPAQQYYQNQGYRRRGSGSNSSGSNQQRRGGNSGYHHHHQRQAQQAGPQGQQRWGGSSNGGGGGGQNPGRQANSHTNTASTTPANSQQTQQRAGTEQDFDTWQ
ncbi:hypothetical protein GGF46_005147 [Coemansia sp. RSA 552]|nr:hypothetical protein GGF46_005147 [Coemansia sp. RSA 552]